MSEPWPTSPSTVTDPASLIAKAASLLFANGQTTHRVVLDTTRLAAAYGYNAHVLAQWDAIYLRLRQAEDDTAAWQVHVLEVKPAGVDMQKVARTNQFIDQVCESKSPLGAEALTQANRDLETIVALKPSSNIRFALMAGAGASALGIVFGVTEPLTIALIFVAAMVGAVLRRMLGQFSSNLFLQPLAAALVAGLLGGYAQNLFKGAALQFVEIAPCMILVPGAHILNASLDLIRGRLGLGVSRLAYCALILVAICTGLMLGLTIAGSSLATTLLASHTPIWIDIMAAGVAVAAFGAFFSLPWKMLAAPVLVGMFCHGSRWLVLESGGGVVLGALVACLIAGCAMTLISRWLKLPFAALAFASVVSMMPGIFIFKFASGLIDVYVAGEHATLQMLSTVVSLGTATLMVVLVMTIGLIVPKMMIEAYIDSKNHLNSP
jgi:uncharacterized membrane protein YjjP (DUF1212 family)